LAKQQMVKPVLSYDVPMGGDGTWAHTGGYAIWSLTCGAASPLDLLERHGDRPVSIPPKPYVLHNIAGGTAHRLAHVFGFWRISEIDTIFLKNTEGAQINYTFTLATGSPHYRSDRVAWYCHGCHATLYEASFDTKRFGLDAFWAWALGEGRSFNADTKIRTCSTCGAVHGPAYGMSPDDDTPEERDARQLW